MRGAQRSLIHQFVGAKTEMRRYMLACSWGNVVAMDGLSNGLIAGGVLTCTCYSYWPAWLNFDRVVYVPLLLSIRHCLIFHVGLIMKVSVHIFLSAAGSRGYCSRNLMGLV